MAPKRIESDPEPEDEANNEAVEGDVQDVDNEEYTIEYIEYAILDPEDPTKWKYMTKWADYPPEQNTLQVEEDMENAPEVINEFWRDVGQERRDTSQYGPNDRNIKLRASKGWKGAWSPHCSRLFAPLSPLNYLPTIITLPSFLICTGMDNLPRADKMSRQVEEDSKEEQRQREKKKAKWAKKHQRGKTKARSTSASVSATPSKVKVKQEKVSNKARTTTTASVSASSQASGSKPRVSGSVVSAPPSNSTAGRSRPKLSQLSGGSAAGSSKFVDSSSAGTSTAAINGSASTGKGKEKEVLPKINTSSSVNSKSQATPAVIPKHPRRILSPEDEELPTPTAAKPQSKQVDEDETMSVASSDSEPLGAVLEAKEREKSKQDDQVLIVGPAPTPTLNTTTPNPPPVVPASSGFQPLQPLPRLQPTARLSGISTPILGSPSLKRKALSDDSPSEDERARKKQQRGEGPSAAVESGKEKGKEKENAPEADNEDDSDDDAVRTVSRSSSVSSHDPLFDGSQESTAASSAKEKTSNDSRRSASPDEEEAATPLPPVRDTAASRAFMKPLAPQVDRHRGSKVKIIDLPNVQIPSGRAGGSGNKTTTPATKNASKPGSTVAAASPTSPTTTMTTSSLLTGSTATTGQTSASDAMSPTTGDRMKLSQWSANQPEPAQFTDSPMQMDTSLPSNDVPAPPTPAPATKGRRKSAMDVTDAVGAFAVKTEPAPAPTPTKPTLTFKKKWKGNLYLAASHNKPLAEIQYEARTSTSALGYGLLTMSELVCHNQFNEGVFLANILPAFEPAQEHGVITGVNVTDSAKVDKLTAYLEDGRKVAMIRFSSPSAFCALYPSTLTNVTESLALKPSVTAIAGKPSLVLVMLQKIVREDFPLPNYDLAPPYPRDWALDLKNIIGDDPEWQRTARYFSIEPKWLKQLQVCPFSVYNSYSARNVFVPPTNLDDGWPGFDAQVSPDEDIETRALVALLTRRWAREKAGPGQWGSPKAVASRIDWRNQAQHPTAFHVFIHADEWLRDGGEMPGWAKLKDTKGSETNMRFFRYGRPTIPSGLKDDDKCSLIEVFPYGTVLAFTADAIIKDMAAVSRIIYNAGAHSFTILLHPHMLGLLEKLVHEDPHKRPAASLASFHIQSILRRGSAYSDLTITTCPPRVSLMTSSRTGSSDVLAEHPEVIEARVQYWRSQLDWSLKSITTPDKLVEEFASSLTEAYPNTSGSGTTLMPMPLAEMERSIASTLTDELMRMQRFPTMYTSYRRFILVHGGRGYDEPKNLEKCQIQIMSLDNFLKTWSNPEDRGNAVPAPGWNE